MTIISSPTISLWALPLSALRLFVSDKNNLEKELGLSSSSWALSDPSFSEAFLHAIQHFTIPAVERHSTCYELYTHWIMVEPTTRSIVGGIGGAGEPDDKGEIMIGYFVHQQWEGKGFATEATKCFSQYLFQHTHCQAVVADTPKDHIASQKVLQKGGFIFGGEVEEGFRWKLAR